MPTWDETKFADEMCPNCGALYSVMYKSLPLKDKDDFRCLCGQQIRSWNETGMYMYTLIPEGESHE
jgi:hypothetical protein